MPTSFPRSAESLAVGGLTPFTAVDYPGKLAAVVFCQGCPLRCSYCQNPDLIDARAPGVREWADVRSFLRSRRGLIDAVVFSGGEPLAQSGLAAAAAEAKAMGFAVGLHTSGAAPARLRRALPLVDWVGFDVKAPFDAYERVTAVPGSGAKARESLEALIAAGIGFEARTTVDPDLIGEDDVLRLSDEIAALGAARFALQALHRPGRRSELPAWARAPDFRAALARRFADVTYRPD